MPRERRKPGDGAGKPAPSTLPFERQRALAQDVALKLLAARERSAAELRERLRGKGFAPDVVEGVLERLRETGLQDDARFAERYAAEATSSRGYASRRVQGELRRRGIGRELAVIAATADPEEELARARAVAAPRARRMAGASRETVVRRISALLARRGYDAETCFRVAAELAAEHAGGPDGADAFDPATE